MASVYNPRDYPYSLVYRQEPPMEVKMAQKDGLVERLASHNHIILVEGDLRFRHAPQRLFQPSKHKASNLADIVHRFAYTTELSLMTSMSPLQDQAWEEFSTLNQIHGSIFDLTHGTADDLEVLQAYFKIFDKFFFFGSLAVGTTVELVNQLQNNYYAQCDEHYRWKDPVVDIDGKWLWGARKCVIKIKQHHGDGDEEWARMSEEQRRRIRLKMHLSMLLHEMVHAFLAMYACRTRNCNNLHKHGGKYGHGEAWCKMAHAVEEGAYQVFRLTLDLGLLKSYTQEIVQTNGTLYGELHNWGITAEDVEGERAIWHEKPEEVEIVDGGKKEHPIFEYLTLVSSTITGLLLCPMWCD